MVRILLTSLLLSLGCGGDTSPTSTVPPPPAPEPETPPPPAEELVVPPSESGKVARFRIAATLTSAAGQPLPDTPYRWTTDERSGWVFPAEGRSDRQGKVDGAWVPGNPGAGKLSLRYGEGAEERAIEYETSSVTPENPPWTQIYVMLRTPRATGYSIDMTPLSEPFKTYYAALEWRGGYTGLQRRGSHFDRQLQFSMWDAPGGQEATVADMGDGLTCERFGHEGHGVQCRTEYPWVVGQTYRFEVTEEIEEGVSVIALQVTDLESGVSRYIGKLRFGMNARLDYMIPFVEDFDRTAPTCLDQEVRSAAFRRARMRTANGAWVPVEAGVLDTLNEDNGNPGTPACANFDAREHPAGLELLMGGPNVRDPHAAIRVTVPR